MKKEIKNQKGITLIALVVTIVVLLILAGVSINLVIGNNGIITKAQDAKIISRAASVEDEVGLWKTDNYLGGTVGGTTVSKDNMLKGLKDKRLVYEEEIDRENEVITIKKKDGTIVKEIPYGGDTIIEGVTIPDGYYYVGGKKDTGIVISDNREDENKYEGQVDVGKEGLIGNQWVWVPVEVPSNFYEISAEPIELTGGSTEILTGVTTSKYTVSASLFDEWITNGLPNDEYSYREPDIAVGEDGISCDAIEENYTTAGFSSLKNMAENFVSDYDTMIASLETYKGFYIGRYELSENGEKAGPTATNKNWYELYAQCKPLSKTGTNVTTRMIYGLQWDATCYWLESEGHNIEDAIDWGNYEGEKVDTGSNETYKANNIYDFAGNCREWSQEVTDDSIHRSVRGGSDYYYWDEAYFRGNIVNLGSNRSDWTCTRPVLIMNP